MWLVVNILLRYCLFLRSAPHRSEAKIRHCTVQVLPMIDFGATRLHKQPEQVCHVKQSNRRARMGEKGGFSGRINEALSGLGRDYFRRCRRLITTAPKANSAVSTHSGQLPVRA
ncbi:hypothetical protein DQY98_05825 [Salmonella enterica subsp. enterica serovar Saintpaul]|nr:hypothetical protein [Salmonella enterica subsp. enterica serovar Saintpaul]EBX0750151.1 hypothetical protein [Salmonella enterica subsp. enterica serovar Saintpaul]ECB0578230.1 hypothetical protein [Salmonella enterica subsp. enterica serovar Saintpaul]ECI6578423.1 hypothetical protein [Salmonella enterica subsp. enterica serovar Saintpaul]